MSDTIESLRRKIKGAGNLESVVSTMKILAAANIGQYEAAVHSLDEYARALELGLSVCFRGFTAMLVPEKEKTFSSPMIHAVIFGSDQGLVGQFNDALSEFTLNALKDMSGKKAIWAVGERIHTRVGESGMSPAALFQVPNSVNAITQLVGQILVECETQGGGEELQHFYIFHNRPVPGAIFEPVMQKLLPLDAQWQRTMSQIPWPTGNLPEVINDHVDTLRALIREHLFISLYRSCAESLASENASRLAAMQRAEKNIGELLDDLNRSFQHLRQASIDDELFDVISGSEILMGIQKQK